MRIAAENWKLFCKYFFKVSNVKEENDDFFRYLPSKSIFVPNSHGSPHLAFNDNSQVEISKVKTYQATQQFFNDYLLNMEL